ncbi:MAG: baseplate J/gp47 family protein [Pyrinomonadaceae bacterium MAG19_C2-C3]|nr:baseplate J/gp47 family protein [Pyrinomonadaceae bacterium MAG19_C2-C3]
MSELYNSVDDFTTTQGNRGWYYMYRSHQGGQLAPMTYVSGNGWWAGAETYCLNASSGSHPGVTNDAVRRWVAPTTAQYELSIPSIQVGSNYSDGVRFKVVLNATTILFDELVVSGETKSYPPTLFNLAANDTIDFEVNKSGNNDADSLLYQVSITTDTTPFLNAGIDQSIIIRDPVTFTAVPNPRGRTDAPVFQWSRTAGAGGTLSGATTANLTANNLPGGTHSFVCTATWADGATATDSVSVTVKTPPTVVASFGGVATANNVARQARVDNGFDLDVSASTGVEYLDITFGDDVPDVNNNIVRYGMMSRRFKTRYAYRETGTYNLVIDAWSVHPYDEPSAETLSRLKTRLTIPVTVIADYTFSAPQLFTSIAALQTAINNRTGGENFELAVGVYSSAPILISPKAVTAPVRVAVQNYSTNFVKNNRATRTDAAKFAQLNAVQDGTQTYYNAQNCRPVIEFAIGDGTNITSDLLLEGLRAHVQKGKYVNPTVYIGNGNAGTADKSPRRIRFKHCLFDCESDRTDRDARVAGGASVQAALVASHGQARRQVLAHGYELDFFDCLVTDGQSFEDNADTQGFLAFDAGGSHLLYNCDAEGNAEDVMYSGAPSSIPGWIPQFITLFRTICRKDLAKIADGGVLFIKNNFELKSGEGICLDCCILDGVWSSRNGEQGVSIVITPQPDGVQNTVKDFQFTRGRFRNTPKTTVVYGRRNTGNGLFEPAGERPRSEDILFENVIYEIDKTLPNNKSYDIYIQDDPKNLRFDKITTLVRNDFEYAHLIQFANDDIATIGKLTGFRYENSVIDLILTGGTNSVIRTPVGNNLTGLNGYCESPVWQRNATIGAPAHDMPDTLAAAVAADIFDAGTLEVKASVAATLPNLAADEDLVRLCTLHTEDGQWATLETEPPADTTAPTGTLTASSLSVTSAQTVTLSVNASDDTAVANVQFKEGTTILANDTVAPYSHAVSYTQINNGTHHYTALITDTSTSGNQITTNSVTVIVNIPDIPSPGGEEQPPVVPPASPDEDPAIPGFPVSISPPLIVREMPFVPPDLEIRNEELFAARAIERAAQLCPQLTNGTPSSPHVVLLETFAWMLAQGARRLNYVPPKTLLAYAALYGITPRAATAAVVTVKFSTSSFAVNAIMIPQGTRISSTDGETTFETMHESRIPAGYDYTEVTARALTLGAKHIPVGTLTSYRDAIAGVSVTNERSVTGGTDAETLESVLARATRYLRRGERLVSTADIESAIVDEVLDGRGVVRGFPLVVNGQLGRLRAGHTTFVVMDMAGDAVDDSLKKRINELLEQRIGNQFFYIRDPARRPFDVEAIIRVTSGYDEQEVFTAIVENLRAEYAVSALNFGRPILTTEIVAVILQTTGVERVVASVNPASLLRAPVADVHLLAYELPEVRSVQLYPQIVPK